LQINANGNGKEKEKENDINETGGLIKNIKTIPFEENTDIVDQKNTKIK